MLSKMFLRRRLVRRMTPSKKSVPVNVRRVVRTGVGVQIRKNPDTSRKKVVTRYITRVVKKEIVLTRFVTVYVTRPYTFLVTYVSTKVMHSVAR